MADEVTNAIDFNDIKQSVEESLGRAPEGWSYLVTTLFTEIKEHCDQKDATYPFILQIKEKLGELRIYHRCDDRHIQSMITATIARANRTFERCSNAAETQLLDGWYTTLCCWCANDVASKRHPERKRLWGGQKKRVRDRMACGVANITARLTERMTVICAPRA
ncbi:hypothetical protein [Ruegeria conchae]|uniref:Uncharacterized protein n=1 Tax=Ruegeria conchae TaxID=981384 RepID=A0A497Z7U9_9RHOB|nr:hypothetical protein [Ruegeria conchae]RLK03468.1 hypothetical protein CLV75_2837 [Ruegeria conchae]